MKLSKMRRRTLPDGRPNPTRRTLKLWRDAGYDPWRTTLRFYFCVGFPLMLLVLGSFIWMESIGNQAAIPLGERVISLIMILGILGPGAVLMIRGMLWVVALMQAHEIEGLIKQDRVCFKCGEFALFGNHAYPTTDAEDEFLEPQMHVIKDRGERLVLCDDCNMKMNAHASLK